jgi:hypothetical protein
MSSSNEARDRANARFKKQQDRNHEGAKAKAAYEAEGQAMRDKTARLKALRLARDSSESPVAQEAAAPTKKPARKKGKSVPLSSWLKGERGDGRRG